LGEERDHVKVCNKLALRDVRGKGMDGTAAEKKNCPWVIHHCERGLVDPPISTSPSSFVACQCTIVVRVMMDEIGDKIARESVMHG
jgi:hypothetical protein